MAGAFLLALAACALVEGRFERHDELAVADQPHVMIHGRRVRFRLRRGPLGAPIAVLVSGFASGLEQWAQTQARLAPSVTTLAYDRCGSGFSDPMQGVCDGIGVSEELAALLLALEIRDPVYVVAYSSSAQLVPVFAARHSEQVAGLLYLEPRLPGYRAPGVGWLKQKRIDTMWTYLALRGWLQAASGYYRARLWLTPPPMQGLDAVHGHQQLARAAFWQSALNESWHMHDAEAQAQAARLPKRLPVRVVAIQPGDDLESRDKQALFRKLLRSTECGSLEVITRQADHLFITLTPEGADVVADNLQALIRQAQSNSARCRR